MEENKKALFDEDQKPMSIIAQNKKAFRIFNIFLGGIHEQR